ncbi:inositol phospholipid synthesis and fat-storage-inducing TM-domain-containing protein [Biscogniauxia marginata]|nr:inositol phospholipid synthesis and fat-storage-inducing TM-domain-containing protein [Biscogniauxia marginata]
MADTYSLRTRQSKMAGGKVNGSPSSPTRATGSSPTERNPPHLPTPLERLVLLAYPVLLTFGTLFSVLNPEARAAPYDATGQSHVQHAAPAYFARKDNLLNTLFVKRGWAWVTGALAAFLLADNHHDYRLIGTTTMTTARQKTRSVLRWALVTGWWVLVTQWCFGPALIDRGFRFSGGRCEHAAEAVAGGTADRAEVFTAAACKAAGGRWSGGHDISGHVFLLVLGSWFLLQEVGWPLLRQGALGGAAREERSVVMADGAVKGAGVEAERSETGTEVGGGGRRGIGLGGKFALVVVGLCMWMLLMTAIYFHTWFEKLTGLLVAFMGIYPIYILPRSIPALRAIIGLPGI